MRYSAYAGRILVIDLEGRKSATEALEEKWCEENLGGFGINNRLCWEMMVPGTEPLDPGNLVILGAGPLVGTLAPGAARVMANSRLPLTGAVASASGAMGLGPQMRWAGYDHIVIRGKADQPTYLLLEDGEVRFLAADDLWGDDIHLTTNRLRHRHPGSSVLAIGPAGERLVAFSLAMIDKSSTLGRGGLGAVLGSKNLKAVVVKGSRGIEVEDQHRFLRAVKGLYRRRDKWELREAALHLGMIGGWELYVQQLASGEDEGKLEQLKKIFGPEGYLQFERHRISCPSCFLADKDYLRWDDRSTCSTSFLNAAILGAALDLEHAHEAVEVLDFLDRQGLCFITYLNIYILLEELEKRGLCPGEELPIPEGGSNLERALGLAAAVVERQGLGDLLASGWRALLKYFGPEAERLSAVIKGQDCLYDPRVSGLGTMEFEQIVSPRGPTSASAGSPTYMPGTPPDKFRRLTARMGVAEEAMERIFDSTGGFNVGRLTRYSEDWFSLFSCLGVCNRHQINRLYNVEVFRELFYSATGMELDTRELMRRAADSWELYRRLNEREGFGRRDDCIPDIWFSSERVGGRAGVIRDYYKEKELTLRDLQRLLDDYYDERSR